MLTEKFCLKIQELVAAKKHLPGALLPILHDIQDAVGYVPAEAVGDIALALNLSRAEVHGVISFYHHFRTRPEGRNTIQVCRAEACQAMGAERLWAHACQRLQLETKSAADSGRLSPQGGTTVDGEFTLQPVYCLGLCSTAPAVALNDELHARVGVDEFEQLVTAARGAT